MRLSALTVLLGFAATLAAPAVTRAEEQNVAPEGFTALFNGKDLAGWRGMSHFSPYDLAKMTPEQRDEFFKKNHEDLTKHWTVQDGELVNDGHGVYATTERDVRDYEFHIDYRTVPTADSGIYLKQTPQVQIWDSTDKSKFNLGADKGSGGLWNNSPGANGKDPLVLADRPLGEWNRFRIRQLGARTWVWLNDKLVVDNAILENYYDRTKPLIPSGPIQLQTHGGEIRWRNIFLKEFSAEESAKLLAGSEDGFTPIFNGKDLTGWAGPVEGYEVVDGALRCRKGHGGTVYFNETLKDFVVRVEMMIPKGGNNGLAIRYPGQGDTAYVGMCELQVLDNDADGYKSLDARQYHGSAYGMAASHRGYLRTPGEWNYQEVTVQGSTIRVELNGTVILNTDLSKVTEYMANSPHPGKDRAEGFFGFAGHGSDVAFRNVRVKKL